MRQIGTIIGADQAETFSDYLLAQRMPNMVEENLAGGNWSVWVENDDHLDRAKAELATFIDHPDDPRYVRAEKHAEVIRSAEEKKQTRLRKQFVNVRTRWGQPRQWNVPLTLTLIAVSVVVGIGTRLGEAKGAIEIVAFCTDATADARFKTYSQEEKIRMNGILRDEPKPGFVENLHARISLGKIGMGDILHGEVWRAISPIFLHFGFIHLLFNMFWMRDLGGMIERQRGTWVLAGLVLSAAVLPNLAQNFWSGPNGGGMSGVNYALFGYAWIRGRFRPQDGIGVTQQTSTLMLLWLVLCMTGLLGPIGNAAHLVGLIIGVVIGYWPVAWRRMGAISRQA